MTLRSPVAISGLAYQLGVLRPIDQLDVLRGDRNVLQSLLSKGLRQYAESDGTPVSMAAHAARRTLACTGTPPAGIEAVVYASISLWEKRFYTEQEINWLLFDLGLDHAYPIGIFLPGCANLSAALRVAANLVRGEGYERVLVVTTDKVMPGPSAGRLMGPDVSILSDAAGSCLVSPAGTGEFDLVEMAQHSAPRMWDLNRGSHLPAFLMGTIHGAKHVTNRVLTAADVPSGKVKCFLTNNYNVPVMKTLARLCGFREDQIYLNNVSRFAHGYAADTLINLRDHMEQVPGVRGDLYFLLGTGHKNWGGVLLQKT